MLAQYPFKPRQHGAKACDHRALGRVIVCAQHRIRAICKGVGQIVQGVAISVQHLEPARNKGFQLCQLREIGGIFDLVKADQFA
jgi:hypothetical protein